MMIVRFWVVEKKMLVWWINLILNVNEKNIDEIYEGWWIIWFLIELIVYKLVKISEKIINI